MHFFFNDEFLCRHFNIDDGSKKQHLGMLCFIISRKVKSQLKRKKKKREREKEICAVYGEGAVTD